MICIPFGSPVEPDVNIKRHMKFFLLLGNIFLSFFRYLIFLKLLISYLAFKIFFIFLYFVLGISLSNLNTETKPKKVLNKQSVSVQLQFKF